MNLIHKTVEELPELTTSVGESWCRQVVVCPSELRGEAQEEHNDADCNSSLDEQPVRSPESQSSKSTRIKSSRRPDKALYTPRAARQSLQSQNSQVSQGVQESTCLAFITSLSNSCSSSERKSSLVLKEESLPTAADGTADTLTEGKANLSVHQDDVTFSRLSEMSLEDDGNESATCDLIEEEFGHVIEIYDFPAVFKTDDLLGAFTEYSDGGMKITWVDDTHALGVFATQTAALHALSICNPRLKTRTLTEGSKNAKGKAIRRAEFIQPVKERPKTDSAVARRMVARALGLNGRGRRRGCGRGQSF